MDVVSLLRSVVGGSKQLKMSLVGGFSTLSECVSECVSMSDGVDGECVESESLRGRGNDGVRGISPP